jgi:hypothetical protein
MSIGVVAVERQHGGDPGSDRRLRRARNTGGGRERGHPGGQPVRNEDTSETKNGSLTSSHAVPAVVRYSHQRARDVA